MQPMTPRERVRAALNHREPDRVPLDIGGGSSTTLTEEASLQLNSYLGGVAPPQPMSSLFRTVRLDEEVLLRLGSDCRHLSVRGPASPIPASVETIRDRWGVTWRRTYYGDLAYYWELHVHPLAAAEVGDLAGYLWPDPDDPALVAGVAEEARYLSEMTDFAVMADCGFKSFWEQAYFLRGYEQLLADTALNPSFVQALLDKLLEINLAATGRFLDAAGPVIDVFRAGDDLATQRGLLMSPAKFRQLLKPIYRQYFQFVRSRSNSKIFFHSCGNVAPLLEDLMEIGVEIINPVQSSALGDLVALKDQFRGRLAFWGGIDTQHVLPRGSPDEVREEVRLRIQQLGSGGGYVVASVHNIQVDVPPANIVAMADAVREFGAYPLTA